MPMVRFVSTVPLGIAAQFVEIRAVTKEPDKLATGAKVVISRVLTPTTVEVSLIPGGPDKQNDELTEDVSAS